MLLNMRNMSFNISSKIVVAYWLLPQYFIYGMNLHLTFSLTTCHPIFYFILTELLTLQEGGARPSIHRSHSVPVLSKDGSITQLDSLGGVFLVIPTTPHIVKETVLTTLNTCTKNDNGNFNLLLVFICSQNPSHLPTKAQHTIPTPNPPSKTNKETENFN